MAHNIQSVAKAVKLKDSSGRPRPALL